MQINQTTSAVSAYQSLALAPAGEPSARYAAPASVTRSDLAEVQISSEGQLRADAARRIAEAAPSAPMDADHAARLASATAAAIVADPATAMAAQAANANAAAASRLGG